MSGQAFFLFGVMNLPIAGALDEGSGPCTLPSKLYKVCIAGCISSLPAPSFIPRLTRPNNNRGLFRVPTSIQTTST